MSVVQNITFFDVHKLFRDDTSTVSLSSKHDLPHIELIAHTSVNSNNTLEYLELMPPFMFMYGSFDQKKRKCYMRSYTLNEQHSVIFNSDDDFFEGVALHFHDFYELTVVLSGNVTLQFENSQKILTAGQCCFCNKRIRHRELYFNGDCELFFLLINESVLIDLMYQDMQTYNNQSFASTNWFHSHFFHGPSTELLSKKVYYEFTPSSSVKRCPDELLQYIYLSINELLHFTPGSIYFIKGAMCRIFITLENPSLYDIQEHSFSVGTSEQLFYDLNLLISECNGLISRSELERRMGYNGEYLNRIIKKFSGYTLTDYKKIFLLKEAARLLIESELSVTEICDRLGYANRTFFYQIFSDRYGLLPMQYRKKHQKIKG